MYGGEEFEAEVKDYIAMTEAACHHQTLRNDGTTLANMQKHFIKCCELEHMFWDQASEKMKWPEFVQKK